MAAILFINRVSPPDRGATGHRLSEMARELAAKGWRVTILTATKNPSSIAGVNVVSSESWCSVSEKWPKALRCLFSFFSLLIFSFYLPRHEVVVTLTDPPLFFMWGFLMRWKHKGALLHWCQDMYPDLLDSLGAPKEQLVARALMPLSKWSLRAYDGLIAIGTCMRDRLQAQCKDKVPIFLVRNQADPLIQSYSQSPQILRSAFGLADRFTVVYAGNLGRAHPYESLLQAAEFFSNSDVQFVVVGGGRSYEDMQQKTHQKNLPIQFLNWVSEDKLSDMLGLADVHVVTMRPTTHGQLVPSKVAGVLAAGRPCVFVGPADCDAAQIILKGGCGFVVDSESSLRFVDAIKLYKTNRLLWEKTCQNAREAAEEYYALQTSVEAFNQICKQVLEKYKVQAQARDKTKKRILLALDRTSTPLHSFIAHLYQGRTAMVRGSLITLTLTLMWLLITPSGYTASMVIAPTSQQGTTVFPLFSNEGWMSGPSPDGVRRSDGESVSDFSRFVHLLTSPPVAQKIIDDPGLMSEIGRGDGDFPRYSKDAVAVADYLRRYIIVQAVGTTGLRQVLFRHSHRQTAIKVLAALFKSADSFLRDQIRARTQTQITHIQGRLGQVLSEYHIRALTAQLAEQERTLMMTAVDTPFAAEILEPPAAAVKADWPQSRFILLAALFVGMMVGLAVHVVRTTWIKETERLPS